MKPLPGETFVSAVANVPRWAATLLTVGSGPRWYGLSAAAAGWIETSVASRPVTAAARAALSPIVLPLLRGIRIVLFLLARAVSEDGGAVRGERGVREQVP
ncbi:hypothetical protein [Streptomyces iakyrus]